MPYVVVSQVVPKLALMPLFIVWFGFGLTSTVVITALICFFPLMENTMTGLAQVPPERLELFRLLGRPALALVPTIGFPLVVLVTMLLWPVLDRSPESARAALRVIRETGVLLVTRVAGMLLAAIAVQMVADGVRSLVQQG